MSENVEVEASNDIGTLYYHRPRPAHEVFRYFTTDGYPYKYFFLLPTVPITQSCSSLIYYLPVRSTCRCFSVRRAIRLSSTSK